MTVHALRPEPLATTAAEDAHRVAHADRIASADLVLSMAVVDAVDLIREGRFGFAEFRLARTPHGRTSTAAPRASVAGRSGSRPPRAGRRRSAARGRREWARVHHTPDSKARSKLRSVTYPGVAAAMADQWGRAMEAAA